MAVLKALEGDKLERALERLRNPAPGSKIEAARDFGIDLTLLMENLKLSPAQRAEQMLAACQAADQLRGIALRRRK
ncbi:hypothetical protein F183_A42300 [Bryobacterales bacterium F-183]|nr:hypothetical protein F183_A42300 [Bryobacterales bacterium F-183]